MQGRDENENIVLIRSHAMCVLCVCGSKICVSHDEVSEVVPFLVVATLTPHTVFKFNRLADER